jgi:hypothetical protein
MPKKNKYFRRSVGVEIPLHRLLDPEENNGESCLFMTTDTRPFTAAGGVSGEIANIVGGGLEVVVRTDGEARRFVVKVEDVIQAAIGALLAKAPDGEAS